jgi:3-oxoacyl-[acyl-carrier-protein] synthase II
MTAGGRIRVAVTGLGVKTPAGVSVTEAFERVLSGKPTAQFVNALVGQNVPFACVVPDFDTTPYFSVRQRNGLDRAARLGLAAAVDALADSGLAAEATTDRWGVFVGTGGVGVVAGTGIAVTAELRGRRGVTAYTLPMLMPSATAARIGIRFGVRGPANTYGTACASGATAIGEAVRAIRAGALDVVVVGGVDSCVLPMIMTAFERVGALSRRADDPAGASRPFDADRDGFVMAEGAAFLVLERWEHAAARGARVYAEMGGYGANSDAYHIVAPAPDGAAAAACMAAALDDARIDRRDVGHINAHGTSTVLNDAAEATAIVRCFTANTPPVTAPKGVVGHMIGGAGAFEAVMSVLTVRSGLVPPVANHVGQSGPNVVDVVADEPRDVGPAAAVSNSFGFGGHNASLVFLPS